MLKERLMSAIARMAVRACIKIKGRQALNIYMFHRVVDAFDPLQPSEPDVAGFESILRLIKATHTVVPLSEGIRLLDEGALPVGAACITFDDGYRDNFTNAAPLLLKYDLPATIFIASGMLDGGVMWNDKVIEAIRNATSPVSIPQLDINDFSIETIADRRQLLKKVISEIKYLDTERREEIANKLYEIYGSPIAETMMRSDDVAQLHQYGVDVGGHTQSHPILSSLDDADAMDEILEGKRDLERILGKEVTLFAYPNGAKDIDYDDRHVEMVKAAGYYAAVTTEARVATSDDSLFEMPRYTPWRKNSSGWLAQMVAGYL